MYRPFSDNNIFCTFFYKFSYLDQFKIFTLAILLYHFYHNVHRWHVLTFLCFFPLYFYKNIWFVQFHFFCKFSYLDRFHSFTVAIPLYHLLPQYSLVTRAHLLSFFLCIFYIIFYWTLKPSKKINNIWILLFIFIY